MPAPREGLSIALLDGSTERILATRKRLESMGHWPIAFAQPVDLLQALSHAQRFDMLFLGIQDNVIRKSLCAVCGVIRIPVLFIVDGANWTALTPWGADFAHGDAIELDVERTSNEELDRRMQTLLRDRSALSPTVNEAQASSWHGYQFMPEACLVLHRDREIRLQPRQFALALELFRNMGHVVSRDRITRVVWKTASLREGTRVLDVCATGVRSRLALHGENGLLLRAVYGQGYQIVLVRPRIGAAEEGCATPG